MEYINNKTEKKTFRDIAFTLLNKILELSCEEFRGGYGQKQIKGNYLEEVYIPDQRKRISQAIEFFSYLLQPFYDKEMEKESKKMKEELEENLKKYNKEEQEKDEFMIEKLRCYKKLFEQLNFLLKRKNYLKGESYEDMEGAGDD